MRKILIIALAAMFGAFASGAFAQTFSPKFGQKVTLSGSGGDVVNTLTLQTPVLSGGGYSLTFPSTSTNGPLFNTAGVLSWATSPALLAFLGLTGSSGSNTGDVTLAGPGTYLTLIGQQISRALITYGNIQTETNNTILGNVSGSTASPSEVTSAQLKTLLNLTNTNSGDVTLAGENYLSIAAQVITAHPINLAGTNVTGILGGTNGGTGINNGANTITLNGDNFAFVGTAGNNVTFTTTGAGPTNITLPASGTLGTNPTTTTGDIIYASTTATPATLARLGVGSANQVLGVSGGLPSWQTLGVDTTLIGNGRGSSFGVDLTHPDTWLATIRVNFAGEGVVADSAALWTKNSTASTAGVPVQTSGSVRIGGRAWSTTATAADSVVDWDIFNQPISGALASTTLHFKVGSTVAGWKDKMTITSGGNLTLNSAGGSLVFTASAGGAATTTFLAGNQAGNSFSYTLPIVAPTANQVLTSVLGGASSALSWTTGLTTLNGMQYNVTSTQNTATIAATNYLFDIAYAATAVANNPLGARITSTNTSAGANNSATALTLNATATAGGTATGLVINTSGGVAQPQISLGGSVSGIITSALPEVYYEETGDVYGTSRLHMQNRNGSNGALFEMIPNAGNPGVNLVDFGFKPGAQVQSNFRLEARAGDLRGGGNSSAGFPEEFQMLFGSTQGTPQYVLSIGPEATLLELGNFGIGYSAAYGTFPAGTPLERLDVHTSSAVASGAGNIMLSNYGTAGSSGTAGILKFQGTRDGISSFQAGAQASNTYNYTLPITTPLVNQVLTATVVSGATPFAVTLGWSSQSGITGLATPSANSVNVSAPTSGVATTAMRSDATLQLDQSIAPTWTGNHTFSAKVVLGGITPAVTLDVVKDFATREYANSTVFTGAQNDVAFDAGTNQFGDVRLGGTATGAFNITSIVGPQNGKRIAIYNATGKTMTLTNASAAGGTAINRILTGTGADVAIPTGGMADLIYSAGDSRWILKSSSNGNSAVPVLFARKTADITLTASSTALQNDADLNLTLIANATYEFSGVIAYNGSAAASNLQIAFAFSGTTTSIRWSADQAGSAVSPSSVTASGAVIKTFSCDATTPANNLCVFVSGIIIVGNTPGTLQLQEAQATSQANTTTILTNSHLKATRVQ